MLGENRNLLLTIFIIFAISVTALIGVIYSFVTTLQAIQTSDMNTQEFEPDREVKIVDRKYDYNFAIPVQAEEPVEKTSEEEETEKPVYDYNFRIPEKDNPIMKTIQIPKIGYNAKIYSGTDGASAVEQGAWHYPSNHPLDGEAIFLCHRRYFRSSDSRSCWYLDRLRVGDNIYINLEGDTQLSYSVESISVNPAEDINVYNLSEDNVIKIISCSIINGKIGGDSHRIVILAKLTQT